NQSFQVFLESNITKYDLIVSNPPYFSANKLISKRNSARSQNDLNFVELIKGSAETLTETGRFCVVIPHDSIQEFNKIANEHKLFLCKQCNIRGKLNGRVTRVLLEFSFNSNELIVSEICIEKEKRHVYTAEYRELLKDYLTIF